MIISNYRCVLKLAATLVSRRDFPSAVPADKYPWASLLAAAGPNQQRGYFNIVNDFEHSFGKAARSRFVKWLRELEERCQNGACLS
jgi:hypothetical protein